MKPICRAVFDSRSSFFAPKPYRNAWRRLLGLKSDQKGRVVGTHYMQETYSSTTQKEVAVAAAALGDLDELFPINYLKLTDYLWVHLGRLPVTASGPS